MKKIDEKKELIIQADKTSNHYLLEPEKYRDLVNVKIQKNYKKLKWKMLKMWKKNMHRQLLS